MNTLLITTLMLPSTLVALSLASPPAMAQASLKAQQVTITYVKSPWYGFKWVLRWGFRRSLPEYAAKQGLVQKLYHYTPDGNSFGGVYFWRDRADAERQFDAEWFRRVREAYGAEGRVEHYTLVSTVVHKPLSSELTSTQALLLTAVPGEWLDRLETNSPPGVLQIYRLQSSNQLQCLIVVEGEQAMEALKKIVPQGAPFLLFEMPVLLLPEPK